MNTQISDNFKAILIKVGLELKKLRWKPAVESNQINAYQGHVEMYKEWVWDGTGEFPDVDVSISLDIYFDENDNINYKGDVSLWVDGVGGNDVFNNDIIYTEFTEKDANDIKKLKETAKTIDMSMVDFATQKANDFANDSYSASQEYKSGAWKEDEDEEY